ncbi:MAG: DUF1566 domain-containing protein, partial [Dysgonamonadaceae bacterium]|nr:DUF1566 domain-containing protein [Dysgonamonadaceae bacterium]
SNNSNGNSAVSKDTKDAAYIGILYTNPASGASLFAPAGGFRIYSNGSLYSSGFFGSYWSSSSADDSYCWYLTFHSGDASKLNTLRSYGYAVRCVVDEE